MTIVWFLLIVVAICFGAIVFFGAPYVPSQRRHVRRAFEVLRPLTSDDTVVDFGSGDGVVLLEALQAGAGAAVGYELNPILVAISRWRLRHHATSTIRQQNMWHARPPKAKRTVVYLFTVSRDTAKLDRMLQRWADHTDAAVDVIIYGHTLSGRQPVAQEGAHHLYRIVPLQQQKAKV